MIENGSEHKEAILRAIDDEDALWSCEYENNMFEAVSYDETISALKAMFDKQPEEGLCDRVMQKCMQKKIQPKTVETVENLQVSYYTAEAADAPAKEEIFSQIEAAGGTVVRFERENRRSGLSLLGTHSALAYKKAATTLLDALDSGAEALVCADSNTLSFFESRLGMLQKEIGREIPLALLSVDKLSEMAKRTEAA